MSHTVRFKITTASGVIFTGPVHGSGGLLGAGASQCAPDVQEEGALNFLRREIMHANEGEPLCIYEPKPGHCALKPNYNGQSDGVTIFVPLKGATAEVLNPSPPSHAGRVRRAKREIMEDIRSGRVPKGVKRFSTLHEHIDANAYGGFCDEGPDALPSLPDGSVDNDAINAVQDELDQWLRKGGAS